MWSRVFVLAVLIVSCLPCHTQALADSDAPPTGIAEMDLQSYQRELSRIEETRKSAGEIRELRRSLPDSWTVKDGGRIYRVPTKEISDALLEIERNPQKDKANAQLEARLHAMQKHAAALNLPASRPNAAEAEGKLNKILARGEFQDATGPSSLELVWARISRWIFEHIIRLLRLLHIREKTGNVIAWGVIFLAIVLLFYVVYGWLSKAARGVRFMVEVEPASSDARQWVQEALGAADRGDYREAIHCAYWASVARLEDIRILPKDRSRTPRESLRLLEHYPREQGVLQTITRSFELIWYGYRPASPAEWAGAKEQMEKMGCLQVSIAPTVPS